MLGLDYLNQPRYVVFSYQIPILALLIQLWHYLSENVRDLQLRKVAQSFLGLLLIGYLGLQSIYVWKGMGKRHSCPVVPLHRGRTHA